MGTTESSGGGAASRSRPEKRPKPTNVWLELALGFAWVVVLAGAGVSVYVAENGLSVVGSALPLVPGVPLSEQAWMIFGAVGVASGVALAGLYRLMRRRVGHLETIRHALLARRGGETCPDVLAVSAKSGPEIEAWNGLLRDYENLATQATLKRAAIAVRSGAATQAGLQGALDTMPQGLMLLDEDVHVVYANGAAGALFDHREEDVVGLALAEFGWPEEFADQVRAIADGSLRRCVSTDLTNEDSRGVLRLIARPTRRGDAASVLILAEDITQRRRSELAVSEFVACAAHELRTPLTNIRLYVEMAMDEPQEGQPTPAECLNVINQESRRLEHVVNDVLSVAGMQAGRIQMHRGDVRLEKLVPQLQEDYRAQAQECQVELAFDLPPKLPVIQGDASKLAQALHNLMGNALKYTPAGGRVTVAIRVTDDSVQAEVSDTGIGIRSEDLEHIFEAFYRSGDEKVAAVQGSGLGLSVAREIARGHGGDIEVDSEPGVGSTFTLRLPLTRGRAA